MTTVKKFVQNPNRVLFESKYDQRNGRKWFIIRWNNHCALIDVISEGTKEMNQKLEHYLLLSLL